MIERTNEQWVSELQSVDAVTQSAALTELRMRLQRSIFYYLSQDRSDLRGLNNHELTQMAEDLAQDATLRVMSNLEHFRGESRFTTWANKIAIRLAISDLRRARYRDFSLDALTAHGDFLPESSNVVATAPPAPELATERDDAMARLQDALREALTERQYQALAAVTIHGVPMDIVAEQMGTNRNALYKLIHDARRKLRAHLESQGLSTAYMMELFQD